MTTANDEHRGISAIELLAIATLLAISVLLVVPRLTVSSDTAKEKQNAHHKAVINAAVERFYVATGAWPAADLSDIAPDESYFPDGIPSNPINGKAYKLDTTTHRAE